MRSFVRTVYRSSYDSSSLPTWMPSASCWWRATSVVQPADCRWLVALLVGMRRKIAPIRGSWGVEQRCKWSNETHQLLPGEVQRCQVDLVMSTLCWCSLKASSSLTNTLPRLKEIDGTKRNRSHSHTPQLHNHTGMRHSKINHYCTWSCLLKLEFSWHPDMAAECAIFRCRVRVSLFNALFLGRLWEYHHHTLPESRSCRLQFYCRQYVIDPLRYCIRWNNAK